MTGPGRTARELNANGSFTYTPNADYNGPDSFTSARTGPRERSCDGQSPGQSGQRFSAVAHDDKATTAEDTTLLLTARVSAGSK